MYACACARARESMRVRARICAGVRVRGVYLRQCMRVCVYSCMSAIERGRITT